MKSARSLIDKGKGKMKQLVGDAESIECSSDAGAEDGGDGEEVMETRISKMTEWTTDYDRFLAEDAEVADIVEFSRFGGAYTHVGLYVGNGDIIEYSGDQRVPFGEAVVRHRHLEEITEGEDQVGVADFSIFIPDSIILPYGGFWDKYRPSLSRIYD